MRTKRKRGTDTIATIDEAVALERAGGTWSQQHAAVITGYSVRYLRASTCPKHWEETAGTKGRGRLVYIPAEVRDWKASLLRKAS